MRHFRPDHPTIAVSRVNLAAVLYHLRDFPAALHQIDQALAIFRDKLPPAHPHIKAAESWRDPILQAMR